MALAADGRVGHLKAEAVVLDRGEYEIALRLLDRLAEAELQFPIADHEANVATIGSGQQH